MTTTMTREQILKAVAMRRDWCWKQFLACDVAGKLWAISVLRKLKCPMIEEEVAA